VYCPTCGSKTVDEARFCSACGAAIEQRPSAADVTPTAAGVARQDEASPEPPSEDAVPIDTDASSPESHLPRVWLIGGAVAVLILLLVAAVFLSGREQTDTTTVAGQTLPVTSIQDEPDKNNAAPDTTAEGTAANDTTDAGGGTQGSPGSAPSTTTTTLTTAGAPMINVENLEWKRVFHDEKVLGGPRDQGMYSVVAGSGLVAVGWDESGGSIDAAVWRSTDGLIWNRIPNDEAIFGGSDTQAMRSVVTAGPGLVAVGGDWSRGDQDAAVWWSVDGLTWNRVPHDETVFGGPYIQRMRAVTAGGPGLVAVGRAGSDQDGDAAVWWSVDGLTWNRVPHDETVFGGPGSQKMVSVAAAGPGLVAVGWDTLDGDADAAIWWSPDGLTWNRVPHDEIVFGGLDGQWMNSVLAAGPGLLAVGQDRSGGDGDAAVWWSLDGLTWSRIPHDETVFGGPGYQSMLSIAVAGPGLVAAGWDTSRESWDAAIWWSLDGLTWNRIPHDETVFGGPDGQWMNSVVATGPGLVAVGQDRSGGDSDAAVWLAVPAGSINGIGTPPTLSFADIASALTTDGYFVEQGVDATNSVLSDAVADARLSGGALSVVVLAVEPSEGTTTFADAVLDALPSNTGTVLVVGPETVGWSSSDDIWTKNQLDTALDRSLGGATSDDVVTLFAASLAEPSGDG